MKKPIKPFPDYAWHWASVEPSEGLNSPPVYFGVLRAIRRCEGLSKSSPEVYHALEEVEHATDHTNMRNPRLRLAREPSRNLFRNSGQYWQALGLLHQSAGVLALTPLGQQVADRRIPQDEFIAATIRTLALPNLRISTATETEQWHKAGLQIFPLRLILEILAEEYEVKPSEAYFTRDELCKVTIPLAGSRASVSDHVEALLDYRAGTLNVAEWPNCTPRDNDPRSAGEFLLFLAYNQIVAEQQVVGSRATRYQLLPEHLDLVTAILERTPEVHSLEDAIGDAREDGLASLATRAKRMVQRLDRSGQRAFRRDVFAKHGARCVVSGETTHDVLVAAHIMHARWGGSDTSVNGLPLRADIHILWDEGLLDIHPDGRLARNPRLDGSPSYGALPATLDLPKAVRGNLEWRLNYQ